MVTKSEICNLALSRLGDKSTVENIDVPKTQTEKTFKKWFDVTRRAALRKMMPPFARKRKLWAKSNYVPDFGYSFAYDYRADCVKVLGIGNMDEPDTNYVVEGNYILTNSDYKDGLPVRYVEDVTDLGRFDDNFIELFSLLLACNVAPEITESASRVKGIESSLPIKIAEVMAVSSQENKPFIVRSSGLRNARLGVGYGVRKH
jgi:hypothetical protein